MFKHRRRFGLHFCELKSYVIPGGKVRSQDNYKIKWGVGSRKFGSATFKVSKNPRNYQKFLEINKNSQIPQKSTNYIYFAMFIRV
jgi:hypothetical protein